MLWIYVPDYTDHGRITSIQNITTWYSDNEEFFNALDVIRESYPNNQTWQYASKIHKCSQIITDSDGNESLTMLVDDEKSE